MASRVRDLPHPGDTALTAAAVSALCCYLVATPQVPDLAAQVARADVVRRVGDTVWWLGWFGGLHLPSYSATTPLLMAVLGVPGTGAAATALSVVAMHRLLRNAPRARLGTAAFLVTALANLLDGRITFAVALMTGLWCLVTIRGDVTVARGLAGGALALVTCLTSPLAGLFLAMAAATLILVRRRERQADAELVLLLVLVALLIATAAATAVLFPGIGEMPFPVVSFLPAAGCALAVAMLCPDRRLRVGSLAYLAAGVVFLLLPTAVGENVTRVAWLFALPLIVAYARVPRTALVAAAMAVALLPALDLAGQLRAAGDPSAHAAYYRPLIAALAADQAAHTASRGQRVEVLDPRNHWDSVYLPGRFALARGWERQADRGDNPLFYRDRPPSAAAYLRWLHTLAVGWVAVPTGPLDYASVQEARVVARHPAYLTQIWSSSTWRLYRVVGSSPLARTATVVAVDDRAITLDIGKVTTVELAVRWSPYLVVTDVHGARSGCIDNRAGWTYLSVAKPGRYIVTADFGGGIRQGPPTCIPADRPR
jgi:hypothetical protein